jgi:hypothetical protein
MYQRMFQAFGHIAFAPSGLLRDHLGGGRTLELLREGDHALSGIRTTGEEHVLHVFQQVLRDIFIDTDLARVHDAHVHARLMAWYKKAVWMASRTGSLPRKLKLTLLTPPLTSTPGRFFLIHFTASM